MDKLEEILRILGKNIRRIITNADIDITKLSEIRLRSFMPLIIRYDGRDLFITPGGKLDMHEKYAYRVSSEDIKETFVFLSDYSVYAFEEEMKCGYITIAGGHRVGIAGKAVISDGRIKNMRYISFINIRVAHECIGCAEHIMDYISPYGNVLNTLIVSAPGVGNTTLLRDIIRQLSSGSKNYPGKNVGVVDERSEICACYHGIPQNNVGIRTDVIDACPKAEGIMMLVRSMSPEIIAVDEIGTDRDMKAVLYSMTCGCKVIATIHGSGIEDTGKDFYLENAFDRIIVLKMNKTNKRTAVIYDKERLTIKSQV